VPGLVEWDGVWTRGQGRAGAGLRDIHLAVGRGGCTILGPGGSGKSALLALAAGRLRATRGRVRVAGSELGTATEATRARRHVGYVPADLSLPPELTVAEFLAWLARLDGYDPPTARERTRAVMAQVHLSAASDLRLGRFSGGMKRRALLAQALVRTPDVLLVDEPTAGLDPEEQLTVWDLLRDAALRPDGTVVVATSNLEDAAALGFPVAVVVEGRLAVPPTPPARLAERAVGHVVVWDTAAQALPAGPDPDAGLYALRPVRTELDTWAWRAVVDDVATWCTVGGTPAPDADLEDGYHYAVGRFRQKGSLA